MKISLPSSPEKNYLSGMDWMMQCFDEVSRKKLGCGNPFQIIFEVEGRIDPDFVDQQLSEYANAFELLKGRLSRDFNLAPYIRCSKNSTAVRINSKLLDVDHRKQAYQCLKDELNLATRGNEFPLKVSYVRFENVMLIGFIFDHRFFDARGAELFLKEFNQQLMKNDGGVFTAPQVFNSAYLDDWETQFKAGKRINPFRRDEEKDSFKTAALEQSKINANAKECFMLKCFDQEETKGIRTRVAEECGPFLFLPYSLARAMKLFSQLSEKFSPEDKIVVSVTQDLRRILKADKKSLFNYLSFLFFKVDINDTRDQTALMQRLTLQFYEQTKEGFSENLWHASMLLRIAPKWLFSKCLQQVSNKNNSVSFSFASVGQSLYQESHFLNLKVVNIFHMPRVPVNPGLGVYFSEYKDKLNLVVSSVEGLLTPAECEKLMMNLSDSL